MSKRLIITAGLCGLMAPVFAGPRTSVDDILGINMRAKNPNWFEVKAAAQPEDPVEVMIYDAIDPYWGVNAKDFAQAFNAIKADKITVRLNSPGGSVFDGIAIYNTIKSHPAEVTVVVDGLAASIASLIMLAGDNVQVAENSFVMIHNAWGFVAGNAIELREMAATLDKIDGTLNDAYVKATGKSPEEIKALMEAETWFTAQEAIDFGFAKAKTTGTNARAQFDLSGFKNAPKVETEPQVTGPIESPVNIDLMRRRLALAERE